PPDPAPSTDTTSTTSVLDHAHVQRLIDRYRRRTWHWQRVMLHPLTLTLVDPPADPLERIQAWRRKSLAVQEIALHPPHLRAWTCIPHSEGAWPDPGPPSYAALRMDPAFHPPTVR